METTTQTTAKKALIHLTEKDIKQALESIQTAKNQIEKELYCIEFWNALDELQRLKDGQ